MVHRVQHSTLMCPHLGPTVLIISSKRIFTYTARVFRYEGAISTIFVPFHESWKGALGLQTGDRRNRIWQRSELLPRFIAVKKHSKSTVQFSLSDIRLSANMRNFSLLNKEQMKNCNDSLKEDGRFYIMFPRLPLGPPKRPCADVEALSFCSVWNIGHGWIILENDLAVVIVIVLGDGSGRACYSGMFDEHAHAFVTSSTHIQIGIPVVLDSFTFKVCRLELEMRTEKELKNNKVSSVVECCCVLIRRLLWVTIIVKNVLKILSSVHQRNAYVFMS